jgi:hypothetical protein
MAKMGAAPTRAKISVSKPSGDVRTILNPFTKQTESHPILTRTSIASVEKLPTALAKLDDYIVQMAGKGPPKVPPLAFQFTGNYDYILHCRLHPQIVSTSDWHDDVPIGHNVEFFGNPCRSNDRLGIFHHPESLKLIKVPNAGCARFYVEFEFGKMLFPKIAARLDILNPAIVDLAREQFGVDFVQGCHWCA